MLRAVPFSMWFNVLEQGVNRAEGFPSSAINMATQPELDDLKGSRRCDYLDTK